MEKSIYCPVCGKGLYSIKGIFICCWCRREFAIVLRELPKYKPDGYTEPKDDDPYP